MKDRAELSRGLLRKAKQDRVAMETVMETQALDVACFHAQQAAEKCLKAFLAYRKRPIPIHPQPSEADRDLRGP